MFETIVKKEGLTFLGWREVPVCPEVLGKKAKDCMPKIMQGFVAKPEDVEKGLDFDRRLYVVRREFEQSTTETYVVSLSSRTIVYKGMFLVGQLRTFFTDLQDERYQSSIALVHSRFSTNTEPSWQRAIHIGLLCITEKLIPFRAMRIRCWQERKTCPPRILRASFTRFCR